MKKRETAKHSDAPSPVSYFSSNGDERVARKKFIAGNWKMYNGPISTTEYISKFAAKLAESVRLQAALNDSRLETAIFPPAISVEAAIRSRGTAQITVGAQNLYFEEKGAFTGEISAPMLAEANCTHVLIGHSERRHIFKETNSELNKKIKAAQSAGLIPVYCVGELLDERKDNRTFDVIKAQITLGLEGLEPLMVKNRLIIAYEPVWAIGTGLTASPSDAQEVCEFIRNVIADIFGNEAAENILVLYGGSVKPENTAALMTQRDIDGALVGGASLDADSFIAILEASIRS